MVLSAKVALNIAQEVDGISNVKRNISTKYCFYYRVSFCPDMSEINKPKLHLENQGKSKNHITG